jgi:hypothetical protein
MTREVAAFGGEKNRDRLAYHKWEIFSVVELKPSYS